MCRNGQGMKMLPEAEKLKDFHKVKCDTYLKEDTNKTCDQGIGEK